MVTPNPPGGDARRRAYRAAARLAREQIHREAPLDAAALAAIESSDILVVPGSYDHVEVVLDALGLPYQLVPGEALARTTLRPDQLVVVNCPGDTVTPEGLRSLRAFVEQGGSLFTTDWALRHIVEPAFPGTIEFGGTATGDDVVRIEVCDHDNPFVAGVLGAHDDPQWWLEGSSYPIHVVDPTCVDVLLTSRELGERYGESPVAVLVRVGNGEIFHMISHYYLQRTELRTERHRAPAMAYATEKGATVSEADRYAMADLTLGDVESAYTSARLFTQYVADVKRRGGTKRKETK